jgi:hypothetical protein
MMEIANCRTVQELKAQWDVSAHFLPHPDETSTALHWLATSAGLKKLSF